MDQKWLGFSNTGDTITVVGLQVSGDEAEVFLDDTWKMQKGDRGEAYARILDRIVNEVQERGIEAVAIKGSFPPAQKATMALLCAAELRGVIIAAAAKAHRIPKVITKGTMSRTFGARTTDEYSADPDFWAGAVSGSLRTGSRETAFLILVANKQ